MDCDGMKKTLIRDLDGSMLGSIGTVVPDSAFEWDGDQRRGLGDYRIPRMALTDHITGDRIDIADKAPNKGKKKITQGKQAGDHVRLTLVNSLIGTLLQGKQQICGLYIKQVVIMCS